MQKRLSGTMPGATLGHVPGSAGFVRPWQPHSSIMQNS